MSASSSISTEEQDLEESPVTTVSVEQEPPSPSGDNGKWMLSDFVMYIDKGVVTPCTAQSTLTHFMKERLLWKVVH